MEILEFLEIWVVCVDSGACERYGAQRGLGHPEVLVVWAFWGT